MHNINQEKNLWKLSFLLIALYPLTVLIITLVFPMHRNILVSECGLSENIAVISWFTAGSLCFARFVFSLSYKENKAKWIWLFFIFMLAAFRELDFHQTIKSFHGMAFRKSWLSDNTVPLYPKVMLIGFFNLILAAVFIPLVVNRRRILAAFRSRNRLILLLTLGMIFMGLGFACDGTVFGRKFIYPLITPELGNLVEETLETLGALTCLIAVALTAFSKTKQQIQPT